MKEIYYKEKLIAKVYDNGTIHELAENVEVKQ